LEIASPLEWAVRQPRIEWIVAMNKLYKVFVSSTSKDLLEELRRQPARWDDASSPASW
jgi:hypothetical protein